MSKRIQTTSRLAHTAPAWKVNIEQTDLLPHIFLVGEFQIEYVWMCTVYTTYTV